MTAAIAIGMAGCAGEATNEASTGDRIDDVWEEKADDFWAAYYPRVDVLEDGTEVQRTPYGNTSLLATWIPQPGTFGEDWQLYNTFVLDADHRGCTSCHEDMQKTLESINHSANYISFYPGSDQTFYTASTCQSCHMIDSWGFSITNFAHAHMNFEPFKEMGGTCNSCHYVDFEGNTLLWDDVKYDVMGGITDIPAEEAPVTIEWNQTEVTPLENMFVEQKSYHHYDNSFIDKSDDVYDNYTIRVGGLVDHPFEMTLQEMIDEFGLETQLATNMCVLNGAGDGLVYQAEVTGIPVSKIIEYAGLQEGAECLDPIDSEGYRDPTLLSLCDNALIAIEMNGEPLPYDQGYPAALWFCNGIPGGSYVRYLSEINFIPADPEDERAWAFDARYWSAGWVAPNMGVLSDPQGVIMDAGDVHLEGYAYAFMDPICELQFSFDRGQSWISVPTEDTDSQNWVYWKLDAELEPGAYVVEMRSSCIDGTGTVTTGEYPAKFLVNVR